MTGPLIRDAKSLMELFDSEASKLPGRLMREFRDGRQISLALPPESFAIVAGPPANVAETTMNIAEFEAKELRRGGHAIFGRMKGAADWLYLGQR